ncbi:MAG: NTP transferase domain-containing protein [Gemmatimonadetes bacterium]|nr:NTP transferase domain-containing protein [Gemmatimonadota bacterium]MBT7598766.1 NTP transferase domain-containing protein [Gemmatimonadota bacterium]
MATDTRRLLEQLQRPLAADNPRLGIVLAAGHGKRIRSATSKMLHEIWGRSTVQRVADAVAKGVESPNQVIVVGIKGEEVARTLDAREGRSFAYQESPVLGLPGGTGDAVRVALEQFDSGDRTVYVFPGDMGLLTQRVVAQFRQDFEAQSCDMMVLTGLYDGAAESNYYGRIVRVPDVDAQGSPTGEDAGRVVAIKEHKDILGLPIGGSEQLDYKGQSFTFTRDELLHINEINTLVVAFRESALREHIGAMDTDNVQGELMLTDLVEIFNRNGLIVRAVPAVSEEEILGFNVKSVWRQMETIATRRSYERLMDIVTIVDEEDFFLDDDVIDQIIALDERSGPLDIVIGKGVQVGAGVQLAPKVHLGDRCRLSGGVLLGEGVQIGPGVELSTYPEQTMHLRAGSQVLARSVLKGNLDLGEGSRIESGVLMTGSDTHPMRVGKGVTIKGTSYLYGCQVDDDVTIEHSVIKSRHVHRVLRRDGSVQPVRYVLPQPEGLDSIAPLD